MLAEESYLDDTDFFVKYRTGDKLVYAGGNWRSRVALIDPAEAGGRRL